MLDIVADFFFGFEPFFFRLDDEPYPIPLGIIFSSVYLCLLCVAPAGSTPVYGRDWRTPSDLEGRDC